VVTETVEPPVPDDAVPAPDAIADEEASREGSAQGPRTTQRTKVRRPPAMMDLINKTLDGGARGKNRYRRAMRRTP
jgi:hypothetical protein